MSNPTRKIKQGACAYCGAFGDVTDDHVIPQCLWVRAQGKGVPRSVPIVKACLRCNGALKSGHDTYLRDLLVVDRNTVQNPVVRKNLPGLPVDRPSLMARDFRDRAKVVRVQRPSGIDVWNLVAEVAEERTREIMSFIVRGLHYYYLHEILPENSSFTIIRLRTREQIEGVFNEIASLNGEYEYVEDGDVFSCGYVSLIPRDHTTLWQLNFYDNITFAVATNFVVREEIPLEQSE